MDKTHINPFDLLMDACGLAGSEVAGAVAEHLRAGCPDCTRNHKLWKTFREFLQNDQSFEPSARTLETAFGVYANLPEASAPAKKTLATLVFDSCAMAATAGLRSAAAVAYRQLVYAADEYSVDLNVERLPDDRLNITGQVLRDDPPGPPSAAFTVKLFQEGKPIAATSTDRLGEFSFEDASQYASIITLRVADKEIEVRVGVPHDGAEETTCTS